MLHFFTKMGKMPDLDWTQYKKMDYTLKFEEKPRKFKIRPSQFFLHYTACLFQSVKESGIILAISWNLVKIENLEEILAFVILEMIKIERICVRISRMFQFQFTFNLSTALWHGLYIHFI